MDWKTLLSTDRLWNNPNSSFKDIKFKSSEFEKDHRRIISSASFRRLQDKTQVFPLDSSDFVRTRLTHSLEVASIAKELGKATEKLLIEKSQKEGSKIYTDGISEVLMCAGLLHDIGNPPFGHFGETVIGDWYKTNCPNIYFGKSTLTGLLEPESLKYKDLCNFEGNAQAFRLLTKLPFINNDHGMNLTNAVLNTIIKYPCSSGEKDKKNKDIKYHKMGYFQGDKDNFDAITKKTGTQKEGTVSRHPLTYLLEAADDIAYATADLEDGYKKGLFTLDEFIDYLNESLKKFKPEMGDYQKKYTEELFGELANLHKNPAEGAEKKVENQDLYAMQNWLDYVRDWFTYCAFYGFKSNYDQLMAGTHTGEIMNGTNHEYSLKILKGAMKRFIFPQPRILKLELAADTVLSFLLDKFVHAILYYDYKCPPSLPDEERARRRPSERDEKLIRLLPDNYVENYKLESREAKSEEEKLYYRLLLINDFISGMTDTYAKTLYQELNGIY